MSVLLYNTNGNSILSQISVSITMIGCVVDSSDKDPVLGKAMLQEWSVGIATLNNDG